MNRYLIWDFDGTLAYRNGRWTSALVEVLRQGAPDCAANAEDLRPHLQSSYPWHKWHKPDQAHPVRSADQWWEDMALVFERAFTAVGVEPSQIYSLARQVRAAYTNPRHWHLFDDTLPTLERLTADGWTHLILSNHVPELRSLVNHLGVDKYVRHVFNSAETGYEKPHPMAFCAVLDYVRFEGGAEQMWMVGDNLAADVTGAKAAGIPAILVRRAHPEATRFCGDLTGVPALLFQSLNGEGGRSTPKATLP